MPGRVAIGYQAGPMDLISTLSSQLGLDPNQAQALAGGVLGAVKARVADQAGPAEANALASALPELGGWQSAASSLLGAGGGGGGGDAFGGVAGALGGLLGGGGGGSGGGGGGLAGALGGGGGGLAGALGALAGGGGGLAGALGGLLGDGAETQALVGVLGKLGLDAGKAQMIAPIALQFLRSRLSPELIGTVMKVVPFLSGGQGAGIAGALGGLFGR